MIVCRCGAGSLLDWQERALQSAERTADGNRQYAESGLPVGFFADMVIPRDGLTLGLKQECEFEQHIIYSGIVVQLNETADPVG